MVFLCIVFTTISILRQIYYIQNFHSKTSIQQEEGYFHKQIGLTLEEEASKALHLERSIIWRWYWTLKKVDQKYLDNFEMWCWTSMEKNNQTEGVRNEAD